MTLQRLLFALLCIFTHEILIVPHKNYYGYNFAAGRLHPIFLTFFFIVLAKMWYTLYSGYRHEDRGEKPIRIMQIRYIFYGFSIYILAAIDFIHLYISNLFYPFGFVFVLCFMGIITYTIVRHRLMEVEIVIRRSLIGVALIGCMLALHAGIIKFTQPYLGYGVSSAISIVMILSLLILSPFNEQVQVAMDRFVYRGRYDYQRVLRKSTRALVTILQLDSLLDYIIKLIVENLNIKRVSLLLFQEETSTFKIVASHGLSENVTKQFSLDAKNGIVGWFEREKEIFVKEEKQMSLRKQNFDTIYRDLHKLGAEVIIPLFYKNKLKGILNLDHKGSGRMYNQNDLDILEALASEAAIAIENAFLYSEAITDGLTRLYHHKYFYARLREEVSRSRRYKHPLSLIMMDIDDFKALNDEYGHLAGDAILRGIAAIIKKNTRYSDIVARYGGEEFCILLPNTHLMSATNAGRRFVERIGEEDVIEVGERIRKNVEKHTFIYQENRLTLTVSLGIASFDPERKDDISAEALLAHADQALYAAKKKGKNRIEVFEERLSS